MGRNGIMVLTAFVFLHTLWFAMRERPLFPLDFAAACYALGALFGLLSLRAHQVNHILGPHNRPLELYAGRFRFLSEWRRISSRRFFALLVLWLCAVLMRVLSSGACAESWEDQLPMLVSFSFSGAVIMALAYCQVNVCCGLELAVNSFCLRLYTDPDINRGVVEWNVLQALLRRAGDTVDSCFLAVSTSVFAALLFAGAEVFHGPLRRTPHPRQCTVLHCSSVLFLVGLVLFTIFHAVAVTEKCLRCPR